MQFRNSIIICALLVTLPVLRATAISDTSEPGQHPQAPSRLQVSGNRQQFSIEADHADAQSAIKALFVQAGKQFDMDNTVTGQITMKLNSQSLETTLASLCKQTFLKYHVDSATGIYHFEQDTDAVAASFKNLDTLNSLLREQLRNFGLDVPNDVKLDGALGIANGINGHSPINRPENGQNSARGGIDNKTSSLGFGGAGGNGGGQGRNGGQNDQAAGPAGPLGQGTTANTPRVRAGVPAGADEGLHKDAGTPGGAASKSIAPNGQQTAPGARYKTGVIYSDNIPDELLMKLLQANGLPVDQLSQQQLDRSYAFFLQSNNWVTINTKGALVPVADVLAELSKQSSRPILLDPSVPRGPKFRINLTLPPCSLEEALNLVLPPARLRWRTIGNIIYVTPNPDFQIFYGSSPLPYVNTQQSQRGQLNNGQQGQQGQGGLGGRQGGQ